jgi:predicted amidohydrolase
VESKLVLSIDERDARYPGQVFNTTCLIGPDGLLAKYRKTHPWIPWEVHASPHDIPGYSEQMFPVADTEIGVIGTAICYDWIFPEAIRQLAANGAEVLIRVSAYMDPWGATEPMNWIWNAHRRFSEPAPRKMKTVTSAVAMLALTFIRTTSRQRRWARVRCRSIRTRT